MKVRRNVRIVMRQPERKTDASQNVELPNEEPVIPCPNKTQTEPARALSYLLDHVVGLGILGEPDVIYNRSMCPLTQTDYEE